MIASRFLATSVVLLAAVACSPNPAPQDKTVSNVETVREMYLAFGRGDVPGVIAALDSTVRWLEAENFIYDDGNPYVGPQAVMDGVFRRISTDLDDFTVTPQIFIDGGQTVVVEGRYTGTVKATGKPLDSQYAHVFEFRDGKVVRFQQYTDTKQWAEAIQQ